MAQRDVFNPAAPGQDLPIPADVDVDGQRARPVVARGRYDDGSGQDRWRPIKVTDEGCVYITPCPGATFTFSLTQWPSLQSWLQKIATAGQDAVEGIDDVIALLKQVRDGPLWVAQDNHVEVRVIDLNVPGPIYMGRVTSVTVFSNQGNFDLAIDGAGFPIAPLVWPAGPSWWGLNNLDVEANVAVAQPGLQAILYLGRR